MSWINLVWLGGHFTAAENRRRARSRRPAKAIHDHEQALGTAMLKGTGNLRGLAEIPGVTIIGGVDSARREG